MVSEVLIGLYSDTRETVYNLAALMLTGSDVFKAKPMSPKLVSALEKVGPLAVKENAELLQVRPTHIVLGILGVNAVTDIATLTFLWREKNRIQSTPGHESR